jgi:hypothetical protein
MARPGYEAMDVGSRCHWLRHRDGPGRSRDSSPAATTASISPLGGTLWLLKSAFVLQQLMLQRTMKRFCAMMSLLVLLLLTLRTWARSRAALQLEVLALRHQLQVLQRTRRPRLPLAKTDRWLWAVLSRICWMANGARHRQA